MGNVISKDAKIAVLCGGMSSEKEVSMRSGKGCFEALQRLGFKNAELVVVDENIAETLKNGKYDFAYNALHGKYGEDGCIQGVLEILKIPYTGCGVMASAVCMNKEYTKRMLSACPEIPLVKWVFVKKGEDVFEKTAHLNYPLITKPVCEGSSFGMTKVNSRDELAEAYKTVGCSGVSRVDFLIVDDIPYILEINTSPGMTETSDLPAQSAVMGIDYDHLVLLILESAGLNK